MKANELMIGDWVHSSFFGITQIKAIKEYEGYGWVLTTTNENWKSDASLSLIPLTAEILEKNGFVRVKREWSSYWYLDFDETIHIEITDKKILNVWMDYDGNDYDQYSDYCMPVPDYVHELQHALRLCGLTELADNFKVE